MQNSIREKLQSSKNLLGPLVSIYDPSVAENLLSLNPDLLVVDMEHSVIDVKALQSILMAAHGFPVLARIRGLERDEIKKVLDAGVSGIIVPGIRSAEEAEEAVQYSRLPPDGIRGAGPGRASGYGYDFSNYVENRNRELVIIQIETEGAFENLEDVLSVRGLDGYFIGPMDLSISLGMDYSWESDEFRNAISRITLEGKKRGLIGGIYSSLNEEEYSTVKKQDFNFVMFGTDRFAMTMAYGNAIKGYRKA